LPASESKRFGIQLPPNAWTDNSPAIEIVYNNSPKQTAFIEDYYEIGLPVGAGVAENVQWKFNATTAHLQNATMFNADQLYISFASSEHDDDVPPETPRVCAPLLSLLCPY
jgi:1-phosphatidylinositol phosphodiesterase